MTPALSPNTRAILLLTAPLIAGKGRPSADLLKPGEYKLLARHLREAQRQPADLIAADASTLIRDCKAVVDEGRLQRLLARGFLLSQVVEHWTTRAIWVVSRADPEYPRRLKQRLRADAPAILYGCGDIALLESGGLAVVGSRNVDDALVEYTLAVGRLAAQAGRTIVSGGAKGIDQAAMRGALASGGKVIGVLADSLQKAAMLREQRNQLLEGRLVLISPFDPSAGFNVGHAMQRNKLIYALADASLVVNSDLEKGGTWNGAVEQLDRLRFVPVFVRSTGPSSPGLEALRGKGALSWPNPENADALESVFDATEYTPALPLQQLALSPEDPHIETSAQQPSAMRTPPAPGAQREASTPPVSVTGSGLAEARPAYVPMDAVAAARPSGAAQPRATSMAAPQEALFALVRQMIPPLLATPRKDAEVAEALQVTTAQARIWLQRLQDEGLIEKQKKPAGYVVKQHSLFE